MASKVRGKNKAAVEGGLNDRQTDVASHLMPGLSEELYFVTAWGGHRPTPDREIRLCKSATRTLATSQGLYLPLFFPFFSSLQVKSEPPADRLAHDAHGPSGICNSRFVANLVSAWVKINIVRIKVRRKDAFILRKIQAEIEWCD